ncbi:pleckstrin-2-like [Ptychodera flava]|uniref:pleckstrin-2-like n=1 Tax=Ptychodera flava TaxID=63121 RepID=UPI00396A365F
MGDSKPTTNRQNYKEGFLVKKGHVRTNWRTRWFVLGQRSLSYYKKKEDSMAIGSIALQGCSVISPCPEYNKKPGVFRIVTRGKKEFLVQAATEEERDDWVRAIGEAIRRSEGTGGEGDSLPQLNVSHSELIGAMQDTSAGVPLQNINQDGKELKNCFRGDMLTEWLVSWSFVSGDQEARTLGRNLLQQGHIQAMSQGSPDEFSYNQIYRFSTLQLTTGGKKPFDSSDEDNSEDDERPVNGAKVDALTRDSKGNVLKQGFLIKRGHVRHTWKTRLFVMKKDPPHLLYYKGSKQEEKPLGEVPLARCRVELVFSGSDSDVKNKSRTNLFKIITHKGDDYILQAHTEEERDEWMKAIQSPTTYLTQ